jgi:hypothetical protein
MARGDGRRGETGGETRREGHERKVNKKQAG